MANRLVRFSVEIIELPLVGHLRLHIEDPASIPEIACSQMLLLQLRSTHPAVEVASRVGQRWRQRLDQVSHEVSSPWITE